MYVKNKNDLYFSMIEKVDIENKLEPSDIILNTAKYLFSNNIPYVDLSFGLDSRLLYSIFKYLNFDMKRISENMEGKELDKVLLENNIFNDINYSKIDYYVDIFCLDNFDNLLSLHKD